MEIADHLRKSGTWRCSDSHQALLAQSSGIDAAWELHKSQGLRCIFVSANLDEPTRAVLLPLEPIEFVGKPVMPVVLQRSLRKAEALIEL